MKIKFSSFAIKLHIKATTRITFAIIEFCKIHDSHDGTKYQECLLTGIAVQNGANASDVLPAKIKQQIHMLNPKKSCNPAITPAAIRISWRIFCAILLLNKFYCAIILYYILIFFSNKISVQV